MKFTFAGLKRSLRLPKLISTDHLGVMWSQSDEACEALSKSASTIVEGLSRYCVYRL